jgi:hypothetical protein
MRQNAWIAPLAIAGLHNPPGGRKKKPQAEKPGAIVERTGCAGALGALCTAISLTFERRLAA